MDDTKKALLSIELDTAALTQNAEKAKATVAALADQLKELKAAGKESGDAFDKVVEQLKKAGEEAGKSNQSLKEFTKGLGDSNKAANNLKTSTGALAQQHGTAAQETSKYSKTLKEYANDLISAAEKANPVVKSIGETAGQFKALREITGQVGDAFTGYRKKVNDVIDGYKDYSSNASIAAKTFEAIKTGTDIASGGISLFGRALAATGIGLVITALASLISYLQQVTPVVDFVEQKTAFLSGAFNTLGRIVMDLVSPLKKLFTDPKQAMKDLVDFLEQNILNRFKAFGVIIDGLVNHNFKQFKDGVIQLGTGVTNASDKFAAATQKLGEYGKAIVKAGSDTEKLKVQQQDLARSTEGEALKAQETELKILDLQKKARSGNLAERKVAQKEIAALQAAQTKLHKDNIEQRVDLALKEIGIKRGLTQQEMQLLKTKGSAELDALVKQGKIYADDVKLFKEADGKKIESQIEYEKKRQSILDSRKANNKKSSPAEKPKPAEAPKTDDTDEKARAKAKADQEVRDQKELNDLVIEEKIKGEKDVDKIYKARKQQIIEDQLFELKNTDLTETQKLIIKKKYAIKQKELDEDINASKKKQDTTNTKLAKSEEKLSDAKLNKYKGYFSQLQGLFGKHTIAAKAAFLAEKGIALAEIVINTQRQVAAIGVATAKNVANDADFGPVAGPIFAAKDIAMGAVQTVEAIVAGAIQAATVVGTAIQGFARGGLYKSDNYGGMISGPGSGTSDSINAKLSNGESIINAKSTQMFAPVLSAINQAGGGRAFNTPGNGNNYALGGIFSGSNVLNDGSNELANTRALTDMARIMAANIPRQILVVEDVQAGLQNKAMLQNMSNF